jgi:hypothetical protein
MVATVISEIYVQFRYRLFCSFHRLLIGLKRLTIRAGQTRNQLTDSTPNEFRYPTTFDRFNKSVHSRGYDTNTVFFQSTTNISIQERDSSTITYSVEVDLTNVRGMRSDPIFSPRRRTTYGVSRRAYVIDELPTGHCGGGGSVGGSTAQAGSSSGRCPEGRPLVTYRTVGTGPGRRTSAASSVRPGRRRACARVPCRPVADELAHLGRTVRNAGSRTDRARISPGLAVRARIKIDSRANDSRAFNMSSGPLQAASRAVQTTAGFVQLQ